MKMVKNEKVKLFLFSFTILYMLYSVCLNHTFTSDHVASWNILHGKTTIPIFWDTIMGGRLSVWATSIFGWCFSKIGVTVYTNQFVYKLLIIVAIAISIVEIANLFLPYLSDSINIYILIVVITISFANPYYVETFVYTGYEWGIGLLLAVYAVHLYTKRKLILASVMVFLTIGVYQSYVAIFLILSTIYIFLEGEKQLNRSVITKYLKMFVVAGIPAVINIAMVNVSVNPKLGQLLIEF